MIKRSDTVDEYIVVYELDTSQFDVGAVKKNFLIPAIQQEVSSLCRKTIENLTALFNKVFANYKINQMKNIRVNDDSETYGIEMGIVHIAPEQTCYLWGKNRTLRFVSAILNTHDKPLRFRFPVLDTNVELPNNAVLVLPNSLTYRFTVQDVNVDTVFLPMISALQIMRAKEVNHV